jgi:hypothetical protein
MITLVAQALELRANVQRVEEAVNNQRRRHRCSHRRRLTCESPGRQPRLGSGRSRRRLRRRRPGCRLLLASGGLFGLFCLFERDGVAQRFELAL